MNPLRAYFVVAVLLLTSCSTRPAPPPAEDPQRWAHGVTIHRDAFGVPHVTGPTDASVVFGAAFARAEDEFHYMEEALIKLLGRAAEAGGEEWLPWDLFVRRLEVERHSRAEYAQAPTEVQGLCDAFAAGLNHFLETHPDVEPRLIETFEPWHALAGYRLFHISGIGAQTQHQLGQEDVLGFFTGYLASTMWAVDSSRSQSGYPMLFINPHIPLDAPYEFSLHSDEGLQISGQVAYGIGVLPIAGHNGEIAWSITANEPDIEDVYRESFVDEDAYRFGDEVRRAERWSEEFIVRSASATVASGRRTEVVEFVRTHNGPLFTADGNQLALKLAKLDAGGVLAQFYGMARAQNLEQFQAAVATLALPYNHLLYAGRDDHLYYLYGGAIPKRDPSFDWSQPVEGSDPRTAWKGFFELSELPQVLDPPSGFLQNSNSSPFTVTTQTPLDPDDFPSYIFRDDRDTGIARRARTLLGGTEKLSFEDFTQLAFDTYMPLADGELEQLAKEMADFRTQHPNEARELAGPVELLRQWDRRATVDSAAALLYLAYFHQESDDPFPSVRRLQTAVLALEGAYGSWQVPFGEVVRLERPADRGASASLPVMGLPFYTGAIFTFNTEANAAGENVGQHGHSYVSVIELGERPRALSVMPYGQSRDPASPHYFDQASLYAEGKFKRAWFTRGEIEQNAVRTDRLEP